MLLESCDHPGESDAEVPTVKIPMQVERTSSPFY